MFGLKKKRRERIRNRPFPEAWADILEKHVAYYHRLTPEDQAELRGHMQVFLDEKAFEGCGGLEISDEIRVVIAAQACILLLRFGGIRGTVYLIPNSNANILRTSRRCLRYAHGNKG
jgi:Mlc titration factor MtfA (ptsG expression regulator)